jgi:hypothetical protein
MEFLVEEQLVMFNGEPEAIILIIEVKQLPGYYLELILEK